MVTPVGDDPKFFKRSSGMPANAYASAKRNDHIGAAWEWFEHRLRVIPNSVHQVIVPPDIRAAGSRIVARAENLTDFVVLESGGKNIGRTIGQGIGDEQDRAIIDLTYLIAGILIRKREAAGISCASQHGFSDGVHPSRKIPVLRGKTANLQVQGSVYELESFGLDLSRSKQLKQSFASSYLSTAVATHIDDQTVLRESVRRDYVGKVFDECVRVIHVKAIQTNVTEVSSIYPSGLGVQYVPQ
jgi:hypothetical protein